ncbi:MAG TPA: MFS transporter [Candidatus Binataceae bacterium]|nr:MFS transporter [Candidatus Binataceae bacterium]
MLQVAENLGRASTALRASRERRLTRLAFAAMLVLGVNVGWLGPFLAQISQTINASLDRTGLILSAIAAGYFIALPAAGEIGHRRGPHFLLTLTMGLDAIGLLLLAMAPTLASCLGAAAVIGFGQCGIDVAGNALVADLNRDRLAATLNYLHMMFGVGATLGPVIDAFALANHIGYGATFAGGAVVSAAIGAALWITPRVEFVHAIKDKENLRALLVHPLIWAISAVLFLYVGAEVGIGAWLYSYLRRAAVPLAIATASAAVSVYWAGLIVGRLLGGAIAHRISARRLAAIGGIVSAMSLLAFLGTSSVPMLAYPVVALIGFGFGPIFPNMIAVGAERFPARVATMTSIVAGGAALGGVALPWAMGVMLVTRGPFASIGTALVATIAMLAVLIGLDLWQRTPAPS